MAQSRLNWDDYRDCAPEAGVAAIYDYTQRSADEIVGWYWRSIRAKRRTALTVRGLAFVLLVAGTAGQILASTLPTVDERLTCTQFALVLFAIAALLLTGDRAFGWTSGWTRYIATAMAMDNLVHEFRLTWARTLFARTGPLSRDDALALFELAQTLETQLLKAQGAETGAWATEFNAGLQLLESTIRVQREAAEQRHETLRAAIERTGAQARTGAVEVTLRFRGQPCAVRIGCAGAAPVDFLGTAWARTGVPAGAQALDVGVPGAPQCDTHRIVEVPAGGVARVEVSLDV